MLLLVVFNILGILQAMQDNQIFFAKLKKVHAAPIANTTEVRRREAMVEKSVL